MTLGRPGDAASTAGGPAGPSAAHAPARDVAAGEAPAVDVAAVDVAAGGVAAGGVAAVDVAAVALQLGRPPRGVRAVAHRCPCGLPDVIETAPQLPDGTPFPTLYYLTCPRASAAVSRLEAGGTMREMTLRLSSDPSLRRAYLAAHRDYLARRDEAASAAGTDRLPAGAGSAGGMPERVKCLHALVAHELAVPGANPLGREAAHAVGQWWAAGPCVDPAGQ